MNKMGGKGWKWHEQERSKTWKNDIEYLSFMPQSNFRTTSHESIDESDNTNDKMSENSECPLHCFDVIVVKKFMFRCYFHSLVSWSYYCGLEQNYVGC
jgi:hypothetical protein